MSITTFKIDTSLRDRLAAIAKTDYEGDTLSGALEKLIEEHERQSALDAYQQLQQDPEAWAEYQEELSSTERASCDALGDAREEYPEYNQPQNNQPEDSGPEDSGPEDSEPHRAENQHGRRGHTR